MISVSMRMCDEAWSPSGRNRRDFVSRGSLSRNLKRSSFVIGIPTAWQRGVYDVIRTLLDSAIREIKPGIPSG
jgi:hypothetical protein